MQQGPETHFPSIPFPHGKRKMFQVSFPLCAEKIERQDCLLIALGKRHPGEVNTTIILSYISKIKMNEFSYAYI